MHLDKALNQLAEIHAQLLRTEVFRGYRSGPTAATGGVALVAAAVQHAWLGTLDPAGYVRFWSFAACACLAGCALDVAAGAWLADRRARQQTLRVVLQFVPALLAGGVLAVFVPRLPGGAALLPGLWALTFGIGVMASRPYLPRAIGWVGLWYLAAGTLLLSLAGDDTPSAWGMGLTFGIGQLAAGVVLHKNLAREGEA